VYALVDCNNFYAACERLFRPDLKHRPIVVLSNNDGCVVARSYEAKALGIKMGVPIFKVRDDIRRYNIKVFSSNYTLYGDISARVMCTLEAMAPRVEVYSIDEAFLDLHGVEHCCDVVAFGKEVRERVYRDTGITVCVGVGPSKTLAKLANYAAKAYPATGGVVDLSDAARRQRLMHITPVDEVWGVGRRLSVRLNDMGIHTALQLANYNKKSLRRHFSVVLERTARELNGEDCLAFEQVADPKQQIMCSRSFGERIVRLEAMREAVAKYVANAAAKLRSEHQRAQTLSVFMRTSMFNANEPRYSRAATVKLMRPTDDTRVLMASAQGLVGQLWREGFAYAKAGVLLGDFYPRYVWQPSLLDVLEVDPRADKLMATMDAINAKQRGAVFWARQNNGTQWRMKQDFLSPAYTTDWRQLPRVR
jgi:DNA polymerase V